MRRFVIKCCLGLISLIVLGDATVPHHHHGDRVIFTNPFEKCEHDSDECPISSHQGCDNELCFFKEILTVVAAKANVKEHIETPAPLFTPEIEFLYTATCYILKHNVTEYDFIPRNTFRYLTPYLSDLSLRAPPFGRHIA